jgi:CelD/BcsL family acetyltransferase involved in cellulose biosynthesis
VNVRVLPARELGPAEIARWSELARATPLYRNPFFRPEFTQAVARVRPVRVAVIEDAGAVAGFFPFEVGRRRAARPVGWPYSDYHGPLLDAAATIDARELVRACGVSAWSFDHLPAAIAAFDPHVRGRGASPYLDLSDGFERYLDGRRSRSDIRGALRKGRKLAREVGPLRLVAHSDDPELLARTIDWKRAQYAETGVRDVLADTGARDLLGRVQAARGADFAGALSVLYAGDVVAALHLGLRSGEVWHSWFPAYNPDLDRYSPGLVLMLELASAAPALGIREIDLGKGEARYKLALATGSVALNEGSVGARPLSALTARAQAAARRTLRAAGVHRAARRALRRVRSRD